MADNTESNMDKMTRTGRRQFVTNGDAAALGAVALSGALGNAGAAQNATPAASSPAANAAIRGPESTTGDQDMPSNIGYAAANASAPLGPFAFTRQAVGPEDVRIDIKFRGVCHSDIHQARDEYGEALATTYPCMPGHEITGIVTEVGAEVTRYAIGDRVGVGCMVFWGAEETRGPPDEQYQSPPPVFTYNSIDPRTGEVTFGGYSDEIVVNEHFVLRIPDALSLEQAAPILCAGVTTWSPLKHWNVGAGQVVGVAGIGGLGHMAIQLAKARGAEKVIAFTTTPDKSDEVLQLGADEIVAMSDEDDIAAHAGSLDFLLVTIPTAFDMKPYLSLLKHDGTLVTVGTFAPTPPEAIDLTLVTLLRTSIAGSLIGSVEETQEVLDFCAEHNIAPDIELIPIDQINAAFDRVVAKDVRFRFVIDSSTLPQAGA